jgi:hypothetical protein
LPILTIGLLWGGGQGVYVAATNRQPTVVSYEQYVATKPRASWLELTDCVLSLTDASVRSSRFEKRAQEAFIPVHPAGDFQGKVHVVVATEDKATLDLIDRLNAAPDQAAALKLLGENAGQMFQKRSVRGLVRFGIDMQDKDRRKLSSLDANLAEDFIVIDEGKQPELATRLAMLIGGLLLAAFLIRRMLQPSEGPSLIPPAAPGGTAPPPLP